MKKLIPFFLLAAGFFACDGPEDPKGEQDIPGEAGISVENFVFEYDNIDFANPDFANVLAFPGEFQGDDTDVTLVYLLWDVNNNTNVWRALPQSLMTENGTIQYTYNFTKENVNVLMTTDFDKDQLESIDKDDWVVRTVVVPGKSIAANGKLENVNLSDYHAVMEALDLSDKPVQDSYNNIQRRK